MRCHVDTRARLLLVQAALDRQFGLRDAAGNATPREQLVHMPGLGLVPASVALGPLHSCYNLPGRHWPLIDGDDGSAAVRFDDEIATKLSLEGRLGIVVGGVAIPALSALVQIVRPREHSLVPAGVRDKLDDWWIDGELDGRDVLGQPRDTPAARARIAEELQGDRATAALARKAARWTIFRGPR